MSRISCFVLLPLFSVLSAIGQTDSTSQPTVWATKPDAAAFEKYVNGKIAGGQKSIDQLLAVKSPRTIENTLVPYDNAVAQVNTGNYLANLMFQVHPDAAFRDRASAMTQKATAFQTAVSLNREVYKALAALDLSQTDAATRYYVQRQLLEFRLAGVDKDDATRARLKKLSQQLVEDQSMFDRNISDDGRTVEIADASALDGLPQDYIETHKAGPDGKIHIPANEPNAYPILTFAKSEDLRRRMWEAFWTRAYPKNREVLMDMMQTRYQIATLLGYSSWADYNAADKMIENGHNIAKFLEQLDAATRPLAERELAMSLAEERKISPAASEMPSYNRFWISELVRRSQYNFDSQSVRPYLPYQQVKQGILDTAATLFHVSFRQELNAPAWDPSVETWDVIDHGKAIGRLYLDMHARPGKYSHAEMAPVLDGIRGKQLPEAALVCNFPAPTPTDPGLMDIGDATTFFHEFGHLMHHILGGQQQWAGISGISMEDDFVEVPSQMLEEWVRSPQILASFAKDYKTGKPIPADLVARMNRAAAFGRGSSVSLQNALASISYDYYKDNPSKIDMDKVTLADNRNYTHFTPLPDTHMWAS